MEGGGMHIVMFSGGADSYAAAKRVIAEVGADQTLLVFADTKMEDEDLYRFLDDAERVLGAQLLRLSEGRDPWQVFHDTRYLGNTRIDPCSRVLKREFLRKWLETNHNPATTTVHLGIHWTEEHRFLKAQAHWLPWMVRAPGCEEPLLPKEAAQEMIEVDGIALPRLYAMGFPHNNCGGFCIKAGHAHFKLLLEKLPERYAYHEAKEAELREYLGKDVAILRDRRGGKTLPMTLTTFRERVEAKRPVDPYDWGGCGCFSA